VATLRPGWGHPPGNEVCEVAILGVPAEMLGGIELGGIRRWSLDLESRIVSGEQRSYGTAMDAQPVNDGRDGAEDLSQRPRDEEIEVLGLEIVVEDVEHRSQPPRLRRDTERGHARVPLTPIVAIENRRLFPLLPRFANRGPEHEVQFVWENDGTPVAK